MGKNINNNIITEYLDKGIIKKGDYSRLSDFYLNNALKSLSTAISLLKISEDAELKKRIGLSNDFESYIWVITSSYYSMFYAVNALFSKNNIKIDTNQGVHSITRIAFCHFFIDNNKLAKKLYELYKNAEKDAFDITQTHYQDRARKMYENLEYEENKRSRFQYEITSDAKKNLAETSINRAKEFLETIEQTLK